MKKIILLSISLSFFWGLLIASECGPCTKAQEHGCPRGGAIGSGSCDYAPEVGCLNIDCIGGTASIMSNGSCRNLIGTCTTSSHTYMGNSCIKACLFNGRACYCAYSGVQKSGSGGSYVDCN